MQTLPIAFEPASENRAGTTDYVVRSGLLLAEFSATETRLSLADKNYGSETLAIQLQGAKAQAKGVGSELLTGQSNYLLGTDSAAWRTHVAQFGRITYSDVYPGIDLTYYGTKSQLEHDFIVHEGASPSSIRMQVHGAKEISLSASGELQIRLGKRVVVLHKPVAYQMNGDRRSDVPVEFALSGNAVGFRLGRYDASLPLDIDPVLDYSTFIGDASIAVTNVAVDPTGNTYITGDATVSYPASTATAACSNCLTGTNKLAVFVTKLNAAGTGVVYSTFIGGSTDPYGNSSSDQSSLIAVDGNGDAVISGWTSSVDFPMKNPIQAGVPSFEDGFLTSLSPDGSSLIFSSRIGGSSSGSQSAMTYPGALAVDTAGNVYLAGSTESAYLPVTKGALNNATPSYGTTVAFLMKLSSTGALDFSGIPGVVGSASGGTGPTGLALDDAGTIYMVGTVGTPLGSGSAGMPWPTTPGAYQTALTSPADNAPFYTRFSADGTTILSSTLVGSGSANGLALTSTHDVILAGDAGYNFPVTQDAYNKNVSTSVNGVISIGAAGYFAKVSGDGKQLLYSSAFGPSGLSLSIRGIAQDANGNLWIAGTSSGSFTDLVYPLQSVNPGSFSGTGFVSKFDSTLHNLLFESYINSATGFSQIDGIALDSSSRAYVAGIASQDFPTTSAAYLRSVTPPPPNYSYSYGFVASIDASLPGPGICFAKQTYPYTLVGTTGAGSFDIVNCGNGPLTISSVGLAAGVFSLTSHACENTLQAGQSCTVSYNFSPTKMGAASAQVSIASNAPLGPKLWTISATATAPVAYLANPSYAFPPQVIGAAPLTGFMVIGNKGTAPLTVKTSRTTVSGPFALGTNSCTAPVPAGGACSYEFTFAPTVAGSATGSVVVYTSDPVTPSLTMALQATALTDYSHPVISGLIVPTISLDGGVTTINIQGSGFFPASTVLVNGYNAPVTGYGDTSLSVSVDPATLGSLGEYPVQVINPGAGGPSNIASLTAFHQLSITSTATVSNPVTKLLYAAIPSTSKTNPNTIVSIDPTTGALGTPIPVLNNPARLALSDDGRYLYVGFYYLYGASPPAASLQRIDLKAGAVDRTFTLPGSSNGIIDMHVVPGTPTTLLVSLSANGSPSENGIALFGDSGLLQYVPSNYESNYAALDNFTFTSDPSTYYGYPVSGSFFGTGTLTATTVTPITSGAVCCDQSSGSIVVSDGTLLYTNSGQVWSPKTKTLLGRYDSALFYEPDVLADATAKRTYILRDDYKPDNGLVYSAIASYDPSTFSLAGALYFPSTVASPGQLTRWNDDGFGFLAGGEGGDFSNPYAYSQLLLVRSRLATPGTTGTTGITSISPNAAIVGSPALTLTVKGSGFNSDSTVLWNGAIRTTSFVSATQLNAAIAATDLATAGSASVTVNTDGNATSALSFSINKPSLTLSSTTIDFSTLMVGTASTARTITVQNSAKTVVSGIAFSLTGSDAASFSSSSTCGATLASGATCNLSVTFTPASSGLKKASLQVSSNLGTQVVSLTGTGASPAFTLSSQSVSFGQVATGTSSSKVITLQNSGGVPLTNIAIDISGTNASDFTETNTCSTTTPAAGSCAITVTFAPSATGSEAATLNVKADGAPAQGIALTGTSDAPDFTLPASTTPNVTVAAGQPATFDFTLSQSGGFSGQVTMSCANLPSYASCAFSPATVSFSSGNTAKVVLSVATQQSATANAKVSPISRRSSSVLALAGLLLFPLFSRRLRKSMSQRSMLLVLLLAFSAAMGLSGCAGSSSGSGNENPGATAQNTPAGTYNITVIATSGTTTHSTTVSLTVD